MPWVVAEVFAGVGSVARGFARAGGFQVAYLNDVDPVARATYLANDSPETIYELRDVRTVTGRTIRDAADGRPVAGLLGCPPCQGWSAAGQRDAADRRNRLLKDFFRLVNSVYPVFFVMENVPSVADRAELAAAISTLAGQVPGLAGSPQCGGVRAAPVPAAGAGDRLPSRHRGDSLPARRPRTPGAARSGITGLRRLSSRPRPRWMPFWGPRRGWGRRGPRSTPCGTTTRRRSGPWRGSSRSARRSAIWKKTPMARRSGYARTLGAGRHAVANHEPWDHGKDLVERLRQVKEGCRPPIEATNGRRYYSQAYTRLHRKGLARTITTNFHNPGSGRFLHYQLPPHAHRA